jgi:beta-galactosidase
MRDWKRWRVDTMKCRLIHMSHRRKPSGAVEVQITQEFSPPSLCWKYTCEIIYSAEPSGAIKVRAKGVPEGPLPPDIPRIGLNLRASQDLDQAQWFGRGPGESYPDKKASQRIGVFSVRTIKDLYTPYDVPQEYGNRMDTRWVRFTGLNRQGRGFKALRINSGKEAGLFSFVAKRHSDTNIEEAKHPCDLVEDNATLLRLDAKVAGVGTGACGPAVREDLKVRPEEFEFTFLLERI